MTTKTNERIAQLQHAPRAVCRCRSDGECGFEQCHAAQEMNSRVLMGFVCRVDALENPRADNVSKMSSAKSRAMSA